jgi:hypothetical protein
MIYLANPDRGSAYVLPVLRSLRYVMLSNRFEFVTQLISFLSIIIGRFSMAARSNAYSVIYSTNTGFMVLNIPFGTQIEDFRLNSFRTV